MSMISQLLWLLVPAMVANMAPVIVARYHLLEILNQPVDGGRSWRGRRLLGDHKTIRGFLVGTVSAAGTGLIQHYIAPFPTLHFNTPLEYPLTAFWFGAAIGFLALTGDSLKSFFKRRLHIRPGHSWPLFDQIDFVIPSLLIVALFIPVSLAESISALLIIGAASAITSFIGVILRIKSSL